MKRTNKKGFTIVELVIVIAVIAILAAVLIPTFSHIIQKAHDSAALQTAENALKVVLAAQDDASLPNGTKIFVDVTTGDTPTFKYCFKYDGHKLEQDTTTTTIPDDGVTKVIHNGDVYVDLPENVTVTIPTGATTTTE